MASLPPLEPLREVGRRLDRSGIPWALGGSALLHALGLCETVRDWDLTVDVAQPEARAALADLRPTLHGNYEIHADHKVVCFGDTVEVICRFAFFTGAGIVRIPTLVTGAWNGFPIGSPEAWAVAYALMEGEKPGRTEKASALLEHIRSRGDPQRLAAMLDQPLPAALAARLRAVLGAMPATGAERGRPRGT